MLLGFGDTALLGNPGNPYVVTLRAAFRARRQRDASVTDGFHRVDALQSV